MGAPLFALAKGYAANKAKDYLASKAEEVLGVPKDSIALATNATGFAKNIAKDIVQGYAKNEAFGRPEIPEEDRSFSSSGGGGGKPRFDEEGMSVEAFKRGGKVKSSTKSKVSTASRRGDGIAQRGKTRGRYL